MLRLVINRWSFGSREKIRTHVSFPLELDARALCTDSAPQAGFTSFGLPSPGLKDAFLYDLSSVVVHEGKMIGAGHYTTYCKNRANDCWILCNDTRVSIASVDVVLKAQAYILFYTHRSATDFVEKQLQHELTEDQLGSKRQRMEFIH
jgi:ubiquitin carboxyl-terminal hydrolase 44/49